MILSNSITKHTLDNPLNQDFNVSNSKINRS